MGEILVVDDDPAVLQATGRILNAYGHSAFTTEDPREALNTLKDNPERFDLIILDWKLRCPIDGDIVLNLIKHKFPTLDIPVLFVTAYTKIASKHLIKLGAYDTLAKPVTAEVLMDAVERALHKRAEEDPHKKAPAELDWQELRKHAMVRKITLAIAQTSSLTAAAQFLGCSVMTLNRWLKVTGLQSFLGEKDRLSERKDSRKAP